MCRAGRWVGRCYAVVSVGKRKCLCSGQTIVPNCFHLKFLRSTDVGPTGKDRAPNVFLP